MGIWLDQQSGQKLGLTVEKTVDSRSAGPVIFFCATIASLRHGLPFCDATWWSHHSGGTEVQQREQQTLVEQMNRWYGKGSYIHNIYIYIHFTYIYICFLIIIQQVQAVGKRSECHDSWSQLTHERQLLDPFDQLASEIYLFWPSTWWRL
jgi:hypothetical protein